MILTRDNSDDTILEAVARFASRGDITHYDSTTGELFTVSWCDNCGALERGANALKIERISDSVHRSLTAVFRDGSKAVEFVGYGADGTGYCERCSHECEEWE